MTLVSFGGCTAAPGAGEGQSLVSVVIPAFNSADTIRRAVDSVLCQTYEHRELIVVDDGSTDLTVRVLDAFGDQVRCCSQANKGPGAARNHGVSLSRGEFIAFLDADDEWLPSRLERTVAPMLVDPNLGLSYCSALSVGPDGTKKLHNSSSLLARFPEAIAPPPFLCSPTATVRRKCFDACGGFDESFRIWEDRDLFIRLVERFPTHHVDEQLVLVHSREDSLRRQVDVDDVVGALYRVTFKALARRGKECDPSYPLAAMHYAAARKYLMSGRRTAGLRSLLASIALSPSRAAIGWLLLGLLPRPLALRRLGNRGRQVGVPGGSGLDGDVG